MKNVDEEIPVCAIYTDMKKAFDTVKHETLLNKLNTYGIRGNALNLIKSYLMNRIQHTEVSRVCEKTKREVKYLSCGKIVKFGVPQGILPCLGPLLFLLYINDLPKQINHPMVLFADGSTALIKCSDIKNYKLDINNTLKDIICWLDNNNLVINLNKTNIMHFHQRSPIHGLTVQYHNHIIEQTQVAKFLGIMIDNKLRWNSHVELVCNKLSSSAYILFNLSKRVNFETVLLAYHSFVASVLRYGIVFWVNSSLRDQVFKAQKRCIRAMCGMQCTDSCVTKFKTLKILTFPSLYILEVALFVNNNRNLFTSVAEVRNRPVRSQYKNCIYNKGSKLLC